MNIITVMLWGLLLTFNSIAYAEDLPNVSNASVIGETRFDSSTGIYTYSYAVSSSPSNTGQVFIVWLDVSTKNPPPEIMANGLVIIKGKNPDGVVLKRNFLDELYFHSVGMRTYIVPFGGNPPEGWSFGLASDGYASWGSDDENNLIYPGQTRDGLILQSRGIPGIREIIIIPDWTLTVEGSVSEEDIAYAYSVDEKIRVKLKTIGPVLPPAELKPADFIDNIINMKHEAFALGWITDKAIEHSLDVKLDNAKKKIAQGNLNAAVQVLKAFINEVEAQGCESYDQKCPPGKHLKPEAYAILKYNAQYLVDNMK